MHDARIVGARIGGQCEERGRGIPAMRRVVGDAWDDRIEAGRALADLDCVFGQCDGTVRRRM
eukprot:3804234-Rhodomonas_salina.3